MSESLTQALALAHAPGQVARRHFGIIFRFEGETLVPQLTAHRVVIRQRSVVDQALIDSSRKRVRPLRGDGGFSGHPRMADCVCPAHLRQTEAGAHRLRRTGLLVDLHARSNAHDLELRMALLKPTARACDLRVLYSNDDMRIVRDGLAEIEALRAHLRRNEIQIERRAQTHREFGETCGLRAVHGETRAIRTTLAHDNEHAGGKRSEPGLESGILQKKADYSAHPLISLAQLRWLSQGAGRPKGWTAMQGRRPVGGELPQSISARYMMMDR